MGYLTMHNYNKETKEWEDISPDDLYISNYNDLTPYFLKTYCPDLLNEPRNILKDYVAIREKLLESGTWYEKAVFHLVNHTYAVHSDLKKLVDAFLMIDKEYPNQYSKDMIKYLKNLMENSSTDLVLSFGHSSGGFWGTDAIELMKSISIEIPDNLHDEIGDNTNISPFAYGTRFFST